MANRFGRLVPRADDYRPGAQTGLIVLQDERGTAGEFLYQIETCGRRL